MYGGSGFYYFCQKNNDWLFWLFGWLVGSLVGWLVWLAGHLVGWFVLEDSFAGLKPPVLHSLLWVEAKNHIKLFYPQLGWLASTHIHIVQRWARDLKWVYMQNASHQLPGSLLSGTEIPFTFYLLWSIHTLFSGFSGQEDCKFLSEFQPSCMMPTRVCTHRVNQRHSHIQILVFILWRVYNYYLQEDWPKRNCSAIPG